MSNTRKSDPGNEYTGITDERTHSFYYFVEREILCVVHRSFMRETLCV